MFEENLGIKRWRVEQACTHLRMYMLQLTSTHMCTYKHLNIQVYLLVIYASWLVYLFVWRLLSWSCFHV